MDHHSRRDSSGGADVLQTLPGLEPAHTAGGVQESRFPQDLAVTHRI